MNQTVRFAVIPVAGLGTRFLPATRSVPKALLPVHNRPLVEYAVEEALDSGIQEIVLVTSPGQPDIRKHFELSQPAVQWLEDHGRAADAERMRRLAAARITYVHQDQQLGLGHAVGCAQSVIGGVPFAVLLPDDLVDCAVPCTRQLIDVYAARESTVIAIRHVPREEIGIYGVMAGDALPGRADLFRVRHLVEKPRPEDAPSDYGVIGRYVLSPAIFETIAATPRGKKGEIELTDALMRQAATGAVYALRFEGQHHSAGDPAGLLRASVYYGMKDPALAPALRKMLAQ